VCFVVKDEYVDGKWSPSMNVDLWLEQPLRICEAPDILSSSNSRPRVISLWC
jgi:hypothetical protein